MDGGYGNNSNLLKEIEQRGLKYIGVIAKNRNVQVIKSDGVSVEEDKKSMILPNNYQPQVFRKSK